MSTTRTEPLGAKDLAIGIHVLMKDSPNWTRFTNHKISEDRRSITIELDSGREFVVSVYEAEKPFNQPLLETFVHWLCTQSDLKPADAHDALVAYVDAWRSS
jgi:hypothetical protein